MTLSKLTRRSLSSTGFMRTRTATSSSDDTLLGAICARTIHNRLSHAIPEGETLRHVEAVVDSGVKRRGPGVEGHGCERLLVGRKKVCHHRSGSPRSARMPRGKPGML